MPPINHKDNYRIIKRYLLRTTFLRMLVGKFLPGKCVQYCSLRLLIIRNHRCYHLRIAELEVTLSILFSFLRIKRTSNIHFHFEVSLLTLDHAFNKTSCVTHTEILFLSLIHTHTHPAHEKMLRSLESLLRVMPTWKHSVHVQSHNSKKEGGRRNGEMSWRTQRR